jgi:enterochelin esterase-like enzyme
MRLLRTPAVGGDSRPAGWVAPARDRRRLHGALTVLVAVVLAACGAASTPDPGTLPTEAAPTAASPRASTPATPQPPGAIESLDALRMTLGEISAASPGAAQERVDELWEELTQDGRVPLVLGSDVVFLYRGEASQVHWRGSFNGWSEPGLEGHRIGATDLWIGYVTLPAASRAEYKIVLGENDWLVDPANPETSFSGLAGVTNVVALPGFAVTDESQPRSDTAPGNLDGGLSVESSHLGYTVDYSVYTPAGYEELAGLPVLYLLDGNDFVDERMGALTSVLDNLIGSGRIEPLIAVFVDAREPSDPQHNRREEEFLARPVEHAQFIADELVPAIDRAYRTDPDPDARAIAGVSYGGVAATYIAVSHPAVFGNLAAFSPSLWVIDNPQYLADPQQVAGARLMKAPLQAVTECGEGTASACLPIRIFLSAGLPDWDVGDLAGLATTLGQKGYRVDFRQAREGHTWDQWRGLSDEMLRFLFGAS